MDKLKQSFTKLLMLWATLKGWQKLSILLASCGVFILLIFIVILGSTQSYAPLYSGIELGDQAEIVNYLKENRIPYRLESERNAVLVPKNQVDDVKLGLAQVGLPKSGSAGYEIFDNATWGMSEFQQRITELRAREGELARMIKRFDSVDDATVKIVIPRQELFLKQQVPSSASVLLKLRSGSRMNPEQVKAVMHLVSRSVQGLQIEDITVADTSGNILSDMIEDGPFYHPDGRGISSVQNDLERQQEKVLANRVKVMFERVFGLGKVIVEVKLDLDFHKRKSTLKEIIPLGTLDRGVIVSTQTMKEEFTGQGAGPGGAPGTTTNVPGYMISTGAVNSEYSKTDTVINTTPSTREEEVVITPGSTKRLTASVVIDGELEGDNIVSGGIKRSISGVKELVSQAIGLNETRGDNLVVQAMPFSTALADAIREMERREELKALITTSIIGFILFILGTVLVVLWWKRRKAMLAIDRTSQEARHIPTIQEMLTSPDMIAAQGEISVLEEQIKAYARSNPKEVANLVNEWLSED